MKTKNLQRMALMAPESWDEEKRTARIVVSTDADVGDGFQLVHSNEAIRWPGRPIPADYDHARTSDTIWGAVTDLQLERSSNGATELVGTVIVDGPAAAMEIALPRLRTGSARFSVDARLYDYQPTPDGMLLVTDWEPQLVSLVAAGQDVHAVMRGNSTIQGAPLMSDEMTAGGDPVANDAQEPATMPAAGDSVESAAQPVTSAEPVGQVERGAADERMELAVRRAASEASLDEAAIQRILGEYRGRPQVEAITAVVREFRQKTEKGNPVTAGHPARIEVTRDSGDTLMRGIFAGLQARVNPGLIKAEDRDLSRQFASYTLLEITRHYLESRGVDTRGLSKTQLISRGFHSTSDFPLLFSNLAGKSLDAAYQEEPHTWRPIARQRNLPDFKSAYDLIVAGALTPEPLLEGGEYKAGTIQEAQATWRLATYARKLTLTRQAIINDDLSAMERVPEMLGRGFRRLESNIIWGLITGNSVASVDNVALFNTAHANVATSTLSINTAGFNTARKAMRKQTDIAGNTINLTPQILMVPTDLEATAIQFLFPTGFAPTARTGENGPVVNAQVAGMQLIVEPRLDGEADVWYLATPPGSVEGIVYGYLAGEEGPTITTSEKRDPDGVELLARFDFGAAVKDFRGFYRSKPVA
jgi:hypothetical protein